MLREQLRVLGKYLIVLLKNDGDPCSESDQEKITTQELANGLLPRFTMKTTLESLEDNRCRFTNQEYVTVNITRIGEIRIICDGINMRWYFF